MNPIEARPSNFVGISALVLSAMLSLFVSSIDVARAASPAGCERDGISPSPSGELRTCCSAATTASYFEDAANDRPGGCAGDRWILLAEPCSATVTGDAEGLIWACATGTGPAHVTGAPSASRRIASAWTPPPASPSARRHQLGSVATRLAQLSNSAYNAIQRRWIGTTYPACNYFVETAFCEDGKCTRKVPQMLAAQFDEYVLGQGWQEITLDDTKVLLLTDADVDLLVNREGSSHGHVAIPSSLSAKNRIVLAQGELGSVTHQLKEGTDGYMRSLRFFVDRGP